MRRRSSAALVLAGLALVGMSDPALAAGYTIVTGVGTYVAGNVQISPEAAFDDISIMLSTTAAAPYRLPFPIQLYGVRSNTLYVNSNGVVSTTRASTSWSNTCLPNANLGRAVAVYWDDIYYDELTYGVDSIYVKSYQVSGVKKFLVSFRGRRYENPLQTIRAEVIFTQNSNTVETRYAEGTGIGTTIGIQNTTAAGAKQFSCNPTRTVTPPGTKLTFRWG